MSSLDAGKSEHTGSSARPRARLARHRPGQAGTISYNHAEPPRPTLGVKPERIQLMQVQVNTSNGIQNKETLERWADEFLNDTLARFRQEITRIEVQLSDENSVRKGAADKRCLMEARLNGHEPIAVNHRAETQDEAFRGATQRLLHALEHTYGKLDRHQHRDRETIRKDADLPQ
jgi:hypothetical protein